jgi:hypothetical protein
VYLVYFAVNPFRSGVGAGFGLLSSSRRESAHYPCLKLERTDVRCYNSGTRSLAKAARKQGTGFSGFQVFLVKSGQWAHLTFAELPTFGFGLFLLIRI